MKQWLAVTISLLALCPFAATRSTTRQQTSDEEAVKQELLRLTEEISLASERKDRAALEQLLAEEFILTLSTGKTFTRTEMVDMWAGHNPDITDVSHTIEEPQVYLYGDTAIVVAIITDRWRDSEGEKSYQERIFDVWRKSQRGWTLIASKPTKVT